MPYSHVCAVREICETITAGGGSGSAAAAPFLDGKLPSHTEANNAHDGAYGIAQKRAEYFQLLGLDVMHVMLVKALESQHMPMPMYSPAGFVSLPGAQGYHTPQSVQQPSHPMQYALQPMQQVHMVQQAHEMQCALHGYDFEGDNFVDAFGVAQRLRVQCSNCNTYENMLDPPRNYVPHDTLDARSRAATCAR